MNALGLPARSAPMDQRSQRGNAAIVESKQLTSRPDDRAATVFRLRVLFALDIPGAGLPGLLLLINPAQANKWLFDSRVATGDVAAAVLGCVWLALGLVSIAGLVRPITFSPLLLVQFAYKLLWLTVIAMPAVLNGRSVPVVLTTVFAFWVVAVGGCLPWRLLLGREHGTNHFPQ